MKKFHQAFCRIWEGKDEIPQEWRRSKVAPLYKNKADPKDTSNWRGLSIGSNLCKLWLICILERTQEWYEQTTSDSQNGFRQGRGCTDSTFGIKRIQQIA